MEGLSLVYDSVVVAQGHVYAEQSADRAIGEVICAGHVVFAVESALDSCVCCLVVCSADERGIFYCINLVCWLCHCLAAAHHQCEN